MSRAAQSTVIFVIDGAGMQAQGLLLAHSLRRHAEADLALSAYLPADAPDPDPQVAQALAALDVAIERLPARDPWRRPYPHGNKIAAAARPRLRPVTVFLDTDMIVTGRFEPQDLLAEAEVAAVPEGRATWGGAGDRWERVYGHFGLPLPAERVRLMRGRRRLSMPYFNAGLVAFRHESGFAEIWRETALRIDHEVRIAGKRPWLDQIAIPVAAARLGLSIRVLEERWNFAISDRLPQGGEAPTIVHYHRMRHCAAWPFFAPALAALEDDLQDRLPDAARALLRRGLSEGG